MEISNMNSLSIFIILILLFFTVFLWRGFSLVTAEPYHCDSGVDDYQPLWLMITVLVFVSIGLYAINGRFNDWDKGVVDLRPEHLLVAAINKAQKIANKSPTNPLALYKLGQSYVDGGLYVEAIRTWDALLELTPDDAEVLGLKATAMYYRDGRVLSLQTQTVVQTALRLDSVDIATRLLLATDHYHNERYQNAIDNWQKLLENASLGLNRQSINNAILKAQNKLEANKNSR
jgi:formate-dependent nitrite reductase complex subunit NrfG